MVREKESMEMRAMYPASGRCDDRGRRNGPTQNHKAIGADTYDSRKQAMPASIHKPNGCENMNKLTNLDAWKEGVRNFFAPRSAQGYMQPVMAAAGSSCGSACGAGDETKEEPKPAPCGASCGAADDGKAEEKPAACGASCGAADDGK